MSQRDSDRSQVIRVCAGHRKEGKPTSRQTKQAPDLIWSRNKYQRDWLIAWLKEPEFKRIPLVVGKNASLSEMHRELAPHGVKVSKGFAYTAESYASVSEERDWTSGSTNPLTTLIRATWRVSANVGVEP